MNLFTKNIRGFVDFGKQAEPKNPCLIGIRILFCFRDPTCKISDSGLWGDVFATVGASLVLDRGVGLADEVEKKML